MQKFDSNKVFKEVFATENLVTSSGEMGEGNCKQDGIGQPPNLSFYNFLLIN